MPSHQGAAQTAQACLRMLRISRWKLNAIAQQVRKKSVKEAFLILKGMRKRAAQDVYNVLHSAGANAENNLGWDIDDLYVAEATVGRNMVLKRSDIRGRSRVGKIEKEFSQIRVVLTPKDQLPTKKIKE